MDKNYREKKQSNIEHLSLFVKSKVEDIGNKTNASMNEIFAILCFIASLALLLSFVSMDIGDSALLSEKANANIKNILGQFGSTISSFSFLSFGLASYIMVAFLIWFGLNSIANGEQKTYLGIIIFNFIAILIAATFFDFVLSESKANYLKGGFVGNAINSKLRSFAGLFGSFMAIITASIITVVCSPKLYIKESIQNIKETFQKNLINNNNHNKPIKNKNPNNNHKSEKEKYSFYKNKTNNKKVKTYEQTENEIPIIDKKNVSPLQLHIIPFIEKINISKSDDQPNNNNKQSQNRSFMDDDEGYDYINRDDNINLDKNIFINDDDDKDYKYNENKEHKEETIYNSNIRNNNPQNDIASLMKKKILSSNDIETNNIDDNDYQRNHIRPNPNQERYENNNGPQYQNNIDNNSSIESMGYTKNKPYNREEHFGSTLVKDREYDRSDNGENSSSEYVDTDYNPYNTENENKNEVDENIDIPKYSMGYAKQRPYDRREHFGYSSDDVENNIDEEGTIESDYNDNKNISKNGFENIDNNYNEERNNKENNYEAYYQKPVEININKPIKSEIGSTSKLEEYIRSNIDSENISNNNISDADINNSDIEEIKFNDGKSFSNVDKESSNHTSTLPIIEKPSDKKLFHPKKRYDEDDFIQTNFDKEYVNEHYRHPMLDLLKRSIPINTEEINESIRQTAIRLENTLLDFSIEAHVVSVSRGPVITRYELELSAGTRVSKIVGLTDNIALALASESVRIIAPIPGRSVIGIEIPNKVRTAVYLRDVLESSDFQKTKSEIPFVLGKGIYGNNVVTDLAEAPHLLVAGTTGSGKSVCLSTIILSFLFKFRPDELKFIFIDKKRVELSIYNGIPHLMAPVVSDEKKATIVLRHIVDIMERRYERMEKFFVRNVKAYNEKVNQLLSNGETDFEDEPLELFPYIVLVIDELHNLMVVSSKEVEDLISRLAGMSRAVGIHLIIATQRPSADVVTGVIKANLPTRMAFQVPNKTNSRIIIDMSGAEQLLGKGDGLFCSTSSQMPERVQGAFVSDDEVKRVVDYLSVQMQPLYDRILISSLQKGDNTDNSTAEDIMDEELWDDAIDVVMRTGKASASFLQRKLKIGYNRAARIIELMEAQRYVGPENGSKPREVYIGNASDNIY